ncbi:hypothetical protein F441_12817 [Phytophthora nicotianae CJ01A1]|uniref:Uncharacterized protein n=2 Tax=Phytophthora nicotianae TaxID=4792 RepID=W2WMG6_PHYNI|nr:hypothetical protein L915_12571 [Phytophthora nicotianae]ETP11720.1 hypothetical protein F441_12817 [Phytophthora nicotianae CJ01A1]
MKKPHAQVHIMVDDLLNSNNHNDIGLSMSDRSENTKYSFKRMRHMTQNLRMSPLPYSGCEAGFLARSEKLPSTDGPSGVCVLQLDQW